MTSGVFDAVLPIRGEDLPRARLLATTMERLLRDLGTLWIVAARKDLAAATALFDRFCACRALAEEDVLPELRSWSLRLRRRRGGPARLGYRGQQVLKLGLAEQVDTPYYLTLDADVVLVRPVDAAWLLPAGRGKVVRFAGRDHQRWYGAAARILGMPASRWEHGVTPAVLSRAAVRDLIAHLDAGTAGAWRRRLLRENDWTEYTLYHTFVEANGRFDELHVAVPPDAWYGANVWSAEDVRTWTPESAFAPDAAFRFCVIQSTAGFPVEELEQRLGSLLGGVPGT